MSLTIDDQQWAAYERDGYLKLGQTLSKEELTALQERIDAIMQGTALVDYDRLLMQLDSETGEYHDAPIQSKGWKGATLAYRKIQDLEADTLFHTYVEHPLFADICRRVYGEDTPVSCFRAMFMNKPAKRGTLLPWHQDAWTSLDRQPEITVWTALDPATIGNGCVQIIPGSYKLGRINTEHSSGFLADEHVRRYCREEDSVYLELAPGEAVLLHNWVMHRSDKNATDVSRRAFSVCYMDGRTEDSGGAVFTRLWEPAFA